MKRTLIALLAFSLMPQAAHAAVPTRSSIASGPASAAIATSWFYHWLENMKKGVENSYGGGTQGNPGTDAGTGTGGGGATQVPEPAMIVLFGAGAAVVALRRRKRAQPAD